MTSWNLFGAEMIGLTISSQQKENKSVNETPLGFGQCASQNNTFQENNPDTNQ